MTSEEPWISQLWSHTAKLEWLKSCLSYPYYLRPSPYVSTVSLIFHLSWLSCQVDVEISNFDSLRGIGMSDSYANSYPDSQTVGIPILFTITTWLCVSLRCWVKARIVHKFTSDDWLIVVAAVSSIFVLSVEAVPNYDSR